MKERGIVFTPSNITAILGNGKTQTRRIVKSINPTLLQSHPTGEHIHNAMRCPYGEVGDRLYVKEKIVAVGDVMMYARDFVPVTQGGLLWPSCTEKKTISPIFMPKWAARLWLEITNVRVERVQDISQADAIAEGAPPYGYPDFPRSWYAQLWDSIHGPGGWDTNPYVWVIIFKRVQP